MTVHLQRQAHNIVQLFVLILTISCITILSGCDTQEITDESTLGNNNAAQTNPDKIERNSMDDVAEASTEDSNTDTIAE